MCCRSHKSETTGEDLHFSRETSKRAAVQDAVAVTGKGSAVGVRRLDVDAPRAVTTVHRVRCQQQVFAVREPAQVDHRRRQPRSLLSTFLSLES